MSISTKQRPLSIAVALLCTATSVGLGQTIHVIGDGGVGSAEQFNPLNHDNQKNAIVIGGDNSSHPDAGAYYNGGSIVTIKSSNNDVKNSFISGKTGATTVKVQDLGSRLTNPELLDKDRIDIGNLVNAITIPDPITDGVKTVQTYDSSKFTDLGKLSDPQHADYAVKDVENVVGEQYIDMRIAEITKEGGTLNVELGNSTGLHTDSENKLTLAAKQSTLFEVDGSGQESSIINWNTDHRVTFSASHGNKDGDGNITDISDPLYNVAEYHGTFTIELNNDTVFTYTVNNADNLAAYNDILIGFLKAGKIEQEDYKTLFDKAVTITNETLKYKPAADDPNDEVFENQGERYVIYAKGDNAQVNINAVLDVSYSPDGSAQAHAPVSINDGAAIHIDQDGLLGSRNSQTLTLRNGSTGINEGVINGNFTSKGVGGDDGIESIVVDEKSYGLYTAVTIDGNSEFTNKGVLNVNGRSNNSAVEYSTIGFAITNQSKVTNEGNINVGVVDSNQNNSTIGVKAQGEGSEFTNTATGDIYIGRGPQANTGDGNASTQIALNQRYTTAGIQVADGAKGINEGKITIGEKVQNAAGMQAINGDSNQMVNRGEILVLGNAAEVPNMNFGIQVVNAGKDKGIYNEGKITLEGVNAVGLQVIAQNGKEAYAYTADSSDITINGGKDPESGTRNYGIWVEGQGSGTASADVDGEIILNGNGAIGVHARGNATVNVHEESIPELNGDEQIVFFAYGNNARINVGQARKFDVSTKESVLFRMENGAKFAEGGLQIKTSGEGAIGIVGTGKGSEIRLTSGEIDTTGEGSTGIIIEGGAQGYFDQATKIVQTGNRSVGISIDGEKHDLSGKANDFGEGDNTYVLSEATVSTGANAGNELIGYAVKNGGVLEHKGKVNFTEGKDHIGVSLAGSDAKKPSILINNGEINVNHGTGILADGAGTSITKTGTINVKDGTAGVHIKNGAKLGLIGGEGKITTNGTAHGILVGVGAARLETANVAIDVLGGGNGIENTAEISTIHVANSTINVGDGSGIRTAIQINPNSSATINVSGNGSGFGFKRADGATTDKNLQLGDGYKINVTGAKGIGIEALTTGIVSTSANVNVTNDQGGPALLAGTAKSTINIGNLTSQSNSSSVVDLSNGTGTSFDNIGSILAKNATNLAVKGSTGDDTLSFTNGNVRGEINSGTGSDFILISGGTLEGGISMEGSGGTTYIKGIDLSKTYHAQAAPGNNTLILDGISARGGSFAADDLSKGTNLSSGWDDIQLTNNTALTLTDNLTLEGHYINIDGTSTLLAGNNVNSIISAGDPSALTVLNSGTIDLTNGGTPGDTLTIKGNYQGKEISTGPSPFMLPSNSLLKINTTLNTGGALSNQITDRLLVEKDAAGVTYVGIATTGGALTDLNKDNTIQANEGISIAQVAGKSAANTFTLKEQVLGGAFAYDLYSFAPGQSDASQRVVAGSGNDFWDYRLANAFVCPAGEVCTGGIGGNGGNSRPQLTPQMPSYISLPLGIASYNMVILDDLHKRLGEVRHDMALDNENGTGELYIRYIGARNKYQSNVSFKNFGYDFNLDVNAFQIGSNLFQFNTDNNDIFRGGAAWIHGSSTLKPKSVDGYSKTKLDSNALALYLTWQKENGFYIDGVATYSRHKASVERDVLSKGIQDLKARGWLASIETGYPFKFDNGVIIEPQAQLTYQSIKVKNVRDLNGANLRYDDFDQTTLRLGVRGYKTWVTEKGNQITPYVRANYYQNIGGGSKLNIVTDNYAHDGQMYAFSGGRGGKAIQVGLGVTATFKNEMSLFGEVDYQKNLGSYGSKGLRLNIGAKWRF